MTYRNGKPPKCLCGECKTCKRRAYVADLRERTGYGTRAVRPNEHRVQKTPAYVPEAIRPADVSIDEWALKWLQEKGFR